MDNSGKKKKNYTMKERDEFKRLLRDEPDLLSKKVDGFTLAKKKQAWARLSKRYNSLSGITPRTVEQLKKLLHNMKTEYKRQITNNKREVATTGVFVKQDIVEDTVMESLIDVCDVELRIAVDSDAIINEDQYNVQNFLTTPTGQSEKNLPLTKTPERTRTATLLEDLYNLRKRQLNEMHEIKKKLHQYKIEVAEAKIKAANAEMQYYKLKTMEIRKLSMTFKKNQKRRSTDNW